jgi:Family of unknown function (DUF6221)
VTDDLAARLLAAIEETEQIAQAAADSAREYDAFGTGNGILTQSPSIALHVRRQDPKATLIRCAADRRIMERAERLNASASEDPTSVVAAIAAAAAKADLVDLAAGYDITAEPAP